MNTDTIKISDLREHDSARYLDTPEAIVEYLNAALEEGDMKFFAHCVGVAARAVGMSRIADDTGIRRTSLYALLDGTSAPRSDSLNKVIEALGLKLRVGV